MKLQLSSLKFDADARLVDFIKKKADKLDTFYDNIIDGQVALKIDNADNRENKIIEFKVSVPGVVLFAKGQSASFEAATDLAVESMRRQLEKCKGKV